MANFTIEYEGDLRCRMRHTSSGTEVLTDAPVDNRGKGQSFSPTDLVASATGACMLTIMGIKAADHGWDLSGTTMEVTKHMVADPQRRIGAIDVRFALPELDERARVTLERSAHTCPVKTSLREDVEVRVHFGWGEVAR
ncbi:MAG: OsmC family protein [Planctomycetota bacterium]